MSEGSSGNKRDCIQAKKELLPLSSFNLQLLNKSELIVVNKIPQILAAIAQATPANNSLIPEAAKLSISSFVIPSESSPPKR